MSKSVIELGAQIVSAQAGHRSMTDDEMCQSLRRICNTLGEIGRTYEKNGNEAMGTDADLDYLRKHPLETIQRNQVVCLESGKAYKLLSNRHLALYGLTPREYKKKWGIPQTTPLSAKSLTTRRRKLAKEMGMGGKLAEWREQRKLEKEEQENVA